MGTVPPAVPKPLMYGPSFPKIKAIMRGGIQRFESRTNRNLFLGETDFDAAGTYQMHTFLRTLSPCADCFNEAVAPEVQCCALVLSDVTFDDNLWPEDWKFWGPPDYWNCPGMQLLAGLCRSSAQREFLHGYCYALTARGLPEVYDAAVAEVVAANRHTRAASDLLPRLQRMALEQQLSFPALIPEVWFNVIGYDKTAEDVAHLEANPQCVDFVFFANGMKYVIEIDDPGHYAKYREAEKKYEVDERQYTKNLRIERSLRQQGWEIFRFSNLEVNETPLSGFGQLIAHLPVAPTAIRQRDLEPYVAEFEDPIPF